MLCPGALSLVDTPLQSTLRTTVPADVSRPHDCESHREQAWHGMAWHGMAWHGIGSTRTTAGGTRTYHAQLTHLLTSDCIVKGGVMMSVYSSLLALSRLRYSQPPTTKNDKRCGIDKITSNEEKATVQVSACCARIVHLLPSQHRHIPYPSSSSSSIHRTAWCGRRLMP